MLGLAIQKQHILCERNSVKRLYEVLKTYQVYFTQIINYSDAVIGLGWLSRLRSGSWTGVCVYLPECPYWNLVYSFHFIVCFSGIEGLFEPFPCTSIFRIWHFSNQLVSNPDEFELCSTLCWSIVYVKTAWLFGLYFEIY